MAKGRNLRVTGALRTVVWGVLLVFLGWVGCGEAPVHAASSPERSGSYRLGTWQAIAEPETTRRPRVLTAGTWSANGRYRAVDVIVRGSVAQTLSRAVGRTHAPALTQVVKRVLVWWLDVRRQLQAGDRLAFVYELPKDEEPIVHAVWLKSGHLGRVNTAVRYTPRGARFARWFDPSGREIERRLVRGPISGYEQITSLINDGRRHRGVDFKAPIGTPVRAPFAGEIVRRNWSRRRNGNCLQIRTRRGTDIYLLHLDRFARSARPGRRVRRGQIVGWSGNTGRSSAPHLHYQLERNGRVLNPFSVHKTTRHRLPRAERAALKAELRRFAQLRDQLSRAR